jgi:putative Holliday junction resolvase
MSLLAIDYGEKVIGLAIWRQEGPRLGPRPYGRIINLDQADSIAQISKIAEEEEVQKFVVGLAKYLNDEESAQTKIIRNFAQKLKKAIPHIEVDFQDESYSTQEAKDKMRNSPLYNFQINMKKIDEVAAQVILESYVQAMALI